MTNGVVNVIFTDYAQPGDRMTLAFDTGSKKITASRVITYVGQARDAATLQVRLASLLDRTNYPERTVLNASAKELVVTAANSNYQKLREHRSRRI